MKIQGVNRVGRIKTLDGGMVYYTRKGEQVARAYQPKVFNPKSALQIAQRSRFSLAGEQNRYIRDGVMGVYGTEKGSYEYQAINKFILNSLECKTMNAPNNKNIGGSLRAWVKDKDLNALSLGSVIASSYSGEDVNIFDPNVTIAPPDDASTELKKMDNSYQILAGKVMSGGSLKAPTEISAGVKYFGTNVVLPELIKIVYIIKSDTLKTVGGYPTVGTVTAPFEAYSSEQLILEPVLVDVSPVSFTSGERKRGFYSNPEDCGSGWSYIYKFTYSGPAMSLHCYSSIINTDSPEGKLNRGFLECTTCLVLGKYNRENNWASVQVLAGWKSVGNTFHQVVSPNND